MKKILSLAGALTFALASCTTEKTTTPADFIKENVQAIVAQENLQVKALQDSLDKNGELLNPRTLVEEGDKKGEVKYISNENWCSGFYPGNMWYTYKLTGDKKWEKWAEMLTKKIEDVQYLQWHHDVGFMIGCSYLNGYRIAQKESYKPIIIQAAKSLATRYRPGAEVIQSWNTDRGWQAKRGWTCPVIIDNMMNLELLFEGAELSGDSSLYEIANKHALTTLKNHFRNDNSCYHVIDYDLENGKVLHKQTAQGLHDESVWARGQAWAIYGYTVCYRYTKNPDFLEKAERVAEFIFSNPKLPKDLVPYWDYNAPEECEKYLPKEYAEIRDASAAACTASALYELSTYVKDKNYRETADRILESLASANYRAEVGTNGNFILMHSVGSIPHGHEIDVPLNYADYYFLEALIRKQQLEVEQKETLTF